MAAATAADCDFDSTAAACGVLAATGRAAPAGPSCLGTDTDGAVLDAANGKVGAGNGGGGGGGFVKAMGALATAAVAVADEVTVVVEVGDV